MFEILSKSLHFEGGGQRKIGKSLHFKFVVGLFPLVYVVVIGPGLFLKVRIFSTSMFNVYVFFLQGCTPGEIAEMARNGWTLLELAGNNWKSLK